MEQSAIQHRVAQRGGRHPNLNALADTVNAVPISAQALELTRPFRVDRFAPINGRQVLRLDNNGPPLVPIHIEHKNGAAPHRAQNSLLARWLPQHDEIKGVEHIGRATRQDRANIIDCARIKPIGPRRLYKKSNFARPDQPRDDGVRTQSFPIALGVIPGLRDGELIVHPMPMRLGTCISVSSSGVPTWAHRASHKVCNPDPPVLANQPGFAAIAHRAACVSRHT